MKIITGNEALRQCIPNTFATVEGEMTWFDKLYQYVEQAEDWLATNITSPEIIDMLYQRPETEPLKRLAAKIITCHALMNAIPSLDLVLTPNGFGIVNTGNVVPASRDRVERLIASVELQRDDAINEMLGKLAATPSWLESPQGERFASTLFPDLSLCRKLAVREHLFDNFMKLQERLITIEATLAETYFSTELMNRFRASVISRQTADSITKGVIRRIQSIELLLLAEKPVSQQTFFDIVDEIKTHPTIFPEWFLSDTARLYNQTSFENKKESTGYWF